MLYFQEHVGDEATRTAHLSMAEEGAYSRLKRRYAATEKPLPADKQALYRLARASTQADKRAVDTILGELFVLTDGGYSIVQLDAQIKHYRVKSSKAKSSAEARWHPAGMDAMAMQLHAEIDATAMLTDNRKPETENRKPKTHTTQPATTVDATSTGFVCFWEKYPATKRKVGREQCLTQWIANNLDAKRAQIMAALDEDLASAEWGTDEGRYIPKPAKWLSEQRYERETPTQPLKPVCTVCGDPATYKRDGSEYCRTHFMDSRDED